MRCLSPQRQFSASNSANHWSRWQRATSLPRMVIASTSQPGGLICYTSSIFDAALRSGEACAGALADHAALPLGERGVDVQGEWVECAAQNADDERHLLRHQA